MSLHTTVIGIAITALTTGALGADRDIQITSIDLDDAVIEIENLGGSTIALDGWRFCSHNTVQLRRYSSTTGLDGVSLDAGESLFIHLDNDAPADPDHTNASALGGVFAPMDLSAYAIALYAPGTNGVVSFGDPTDIADHVQFSLNGQNNLNADERTDEAVVGGLWTAIDQWVAISANSNLIVLNDLSGAELHGPADYDALPLNCPADLAPPFGVLNLQDVFTYLAMFNAQSPEADLAAPFGTFNLQDVFAYLGLFNAGCP